MHIKNQQIYIWLSDVKSVYFVDLWQNTLTIIHKKVSISEISCDNQPKKCIFDRLVAKKFDSSTRSLKDLFFSVGHIISINFYKQCQNNYPFRQLIAKIICVIKVGLKNKEF